MPHTIFTSILPVVPGRQQALREKLVSLDYKGAAPEQDPLGFTSIPCLHYASLFIYQDPQDGWCLVFENNIDGTPADYFEQLLDTAKSRDADELLSIFRCCEGFEQGSIGELAAYLLRYLQLPSAAYSGSVGRTRNQILFEAELHSLASNVVDELEPGFDAERAAKAVHQALAEDSRFDKLAEIPPETPQAEDLLRAQSLEGRPFKLSAIQGVGDLLKNIFRAAASAWRESGPGVVLKALGAAFVFILLGIWNLRKEIAAPADTWRPDLKQLQAQRAFEDFGASNHMVSIVHTYDDASRRWAKWSAFTLLDFLARFRFTHGVLGSIPTIHFAHWSAINNKRRLLFVSNYDGSWDSYLDDFTEKAAPGLTLAWAHGKGMPKSLFMVFGGAAQGPAFIDWARRSMVPTLLWYKAYPHLSIRNINRNSALRQAIARDTQQNNTGNWLELV